MSAASRAGGGGSGIARAGASGCSGGAVSVPAQAHTTSDSTIRRRRLTPQRTLDRRRAAGQGTIQAWTRGDTTAYNVTHYHTANPRKPEGPPRWNGRCFARAHAHVSLVGPGVRSRALVAGR